MSAKTFDIRSDLQGVMFASFAGVAGVALLSLIALIWSIGQQGTVRGVVMLMALMGFVACGVVVAVCMRIMTRLPSHAVAVDDDGIWKVQAGKESSFVAWERVRGVRRRPVSQGLDLLDEHGRELICLNAQLYEFGLLEEIIAERATRLHALDKDGSPILSAASPLQTPSTYHCRSIRYYGFVGILALFLMALLRRPAGFGYFLDGAIAGLLTVLFWRGNFVRRVAITPEHLDLKLLVRKQALVRDAIDDIAVANVSMLGPGGLPYSYFDFTGIDATGVVISLHDGKRRLALYDMGVHPEDLARRLNAWLDAGRETPRADEVAQTASISA